MRWPRSIPDARVAVIDGAAHLVNVECPDAVTDAILQHLRRQSSGHDRRRPLRDGMRIRREVLGDEHVDRAVAATTPLTEPFQEFITRDGVGRRVGASRTGPPNTLVHHARRS